MSTEVVFNGVARIEIERVPRSRNNQWVGVTVFDADGNEIGNVAFFPSHKGGASVAPSITANCHIAITKSE